MTASLLIAVPTHSGAIDSVTADTLLRIQRRVLEAGGSFEARFPSASNIAMLRNLIVADFLHSGASRLFMLDADQGLTQAGVDRLLGRDNPVVGCLYPKRRYDWGAVTALPAASVEAVLRQAMSFVGVPEQTPTQAELSDGFIRAHYVGAGALLISRDALVRMMAHYPDLKGSGFDPAEFDGPRFAANWGFFNPLGASSAHPALAEDYAFCARWRAAGGEIWADISSVAAHVGRHMFSGAYVDSLGLRPAP